MSNEHVHQAVSQAVQQAWDAWASRHPSLAGVIDRIELTQQTVECLRESPDYRQALESYHRGMSESDLVGRLSDVARDILTTILTN